MPYETFTVAHTPVVAHHPQLGAIHDSGKQIEISSDPQRVSYHHLLCEIHLWNVYRIIAFKRREEPVRVSHRILSETYAAVEAIDRNYFHNGARQRCGCPRMQTYQPRAGNEDIWREKIWNAVRHRISRRHQGQSARRLVMYRYIGLLCRHRQHQSR